MQRIGARGSERGVVAPMTALIMVFLLGMSAFAIDVATMYSEHAQLQNGADASALAIAKQCSKSPTACAANQSAAAAGYANGNALDAHSNVLSAVADATAGTIDVTLQAQEPDGSNHFSLQFAKAIGISTTDIQASASAKWGYPSSGKGFPLAFSQSCWNLGPATPTGGDVQKITWKPGTPSCTNASGLTIPGGWGWLDDASTDPCTAVTSVGNFTTSNPGNNPPTTCETILQGWKNTLLAGGTVKVTFPIFDTASGTGNTGVFHIVGYATFSIWGWHFGNSSGPYEFRDSATDPGMNASLACSGGNDRCIIGQFVEYTTSTGGSGGSDFGTDSVSLIK
ncbi:pilus assembly protein [Arthrobacter sp. NQ7]|uniref:TadE/TadG family type IV pilus assembly protein n=1 Tax=Arthrobacter sp. NQ7 TaxID=3032303 RepID=UPI002410B0C9|nr:TadE/TadG family type IV pilus assembly protein [Arthrobacter sp. NQ7]MDJ0456116.1 pilus assembly protein [Arthrobacter sp. NQ7]